MRGLALCSVALALAVAGCGGGDDGSGSTAATTSGSDTAATVSAGPEGCKQVSQPPQKPNGGAKKPSAPLDPGKRYLATIETNCGSFTITLDQKKAPQTAASFVALARSGFYEETVFHRIVPGFVIQGGDPTGTGTGGPGYKTVDKPPRSTRYTRGSVAMAKGGDEAPGTAGSQFFVVTGQDAGLPPDYALLGEVTKGLDVAERIGMLGDPATEQPTAVVAIASVKVASS
jgi:peptidyl-prolyl cis-trans isomerase B (cyclophilin B)